MSQASDPLRELQNKQSLMGIPIMSNRRPFEGEAEAPSPWRQCIEKTLPCFFRKPDTFGEGISFHQSLITTHRRFRPWKELNEEEKKDRIHYLWQ